MFTEVFVFWLDAGGLWSLQGALVMLGGALVLLGGCVPAVGSGPARGALVLLVGLWSC